MDLQQNDFDRLVFFEAARKSSEANYAKNPLDADVSSPVLGFSYVIIDI